MTDDQWRADLINVLTSSTSADDEWLLRVVTWLDTSAGPPRTAFQNVAWAWLFATALELLHQVMRGRGDENPRIEQTMTAARLFAVDPTEDNYDELFWAATDSYPFGPGDGCLAVPETSADNCERGSGCSSGSGSLYYIAQEVGAGALRAVLRDEVPGRLLEVRLPLPDWP